MDEDNQSGDLTGLFIAEEASLNTLPNPAIWYEREPNSYQDFGGNFAMTTRKPIVHDRQHSKGQASDDNPTAGWNEDVTLTNMVRLLQGFLFADAREPASTAPLNGTTVVIDDVDADSYNAAAGLDVFAANQIVFAKGFGEPDNNGINIVTAAVAAGVTMASPLTVEAAPPADASLTVVGHQFAAGDLTMTVFADRVVLASATVDLSTLPLPLGGYVFIGGDDAITRFADAGDNAPFYGRVSAVADDGSSITLDKTTGVQVTDAGAAKTIQVFFGTVIRNEDDCALIKKRSYHMERQYGCGDGSVEADGVTGAVPNQLTITVPTPGENVKVTADLAFVASQSYERTAAEGPLAAGWVEGLNEPAYIPGLDVYQHKLVELDPSTLNPTGIVSYNSDVSLVVNNNLAGIKAIETFGNSGMNVGEFNVSGQINSFWNGVAGTRGVRLSKDYTWHLILTKKKHGLIFDIASLGLGNGRATVEKNQPVKLPLENGAGKGEFGYTLLTCFMPYLPSVAMTQ